MKHLKLFENKELNIKPIFIKYVLEELNFVEDIQNAFELYEKNPDNIVYSYKLYDLLLFKKNIVWGFDWGRYVIKFDIKHGEYHTKKYFIYDDKISSFRQVDKIEEELLHNINLETGGILFTKKEKTHIAKLDLSDYKLFKDKETQSNVMKQINTDSIKESNTRWDEISNVDQIFTNFVFNETDFIKKSEKIIKLSSTLIDKVIYEYTLYDTILIPYNWKYKQTWLEAGQRYVILHKHEEPDGFKRLRFYIIDSSTNEVRRATVTEETVLDLDLDFYPQTKIKTISIHDFIKLKKDDKVLKTLKQINLDKLKSFESYNKQRSLYDNISQHQNKEKTKEEIKNIFRNYLLTETELSLISNDISNGKLNKDELDTTILIYTLYDTKEFGNKYKEVKENFNYIIEEYYFNEENGNEIRRTYVFDKNSNTFRALKSSKEIDFFNNLDIDYTKDLNLKSSILEEIDLNDFLNVMDKTHNFLKKLNE